LDRILNQIYLGNSIKDFLICLGIILLSIIIVRVFNFFILRRLKQIAEKSKTKVDDLIISAIEKYVLPLLYFVAIYLGIDYLKIQPNAKKIVDSAIIVITTYFAIRFIASIIRYAIRHYWEKREDQGEATASLKWLSNLISLLIWVLGVIFLLDNLGFKISTIIAGLGIGGIAIALAAQAVLGDFFSYFVILLDKPFQIGDFIIVNDKKGVIEKIGIKTTRMKSISVEQVVFPNSDLTKSRIHNFKKMERRRVVFKIGVIYETSLENLKVIPQIIKSIIESIDRTTFDRSHFASYGNFSLDYETVYFVESPDYNLYMNIQQEINLRLFEEFDKRNIVFAYPTQTLYIGGTETKAN
jgi:small-conductance mechanosensitive channel